jgi:hypothetical protein
MSHRFRTTHLILFTLRDSSCRYCVCHRVYTSSCANYIRMHHFSYLVPHYILTTHSTLFTPHITVHPAYPIVLKPLVHISPCSSTTHRIPTTYLIALTLYISQCCFYLPPLTHYVSHFFRNTNDIEFSLQVWSCSQCVSHQLLINFHYLYYRVHTTYLTNLLLLLTTCLIMFTLRISPTYH